MPATSRAQSSGVISSLRILPTSPSSKAIVLPKRPSASSKAHDLGGVSRDHVALLGLPPDDGPAQGEDLDHGHGELLLHERLHERGVRPARGLAHDLPDQEGGRPAVPRPDGGDSAALACHDLLDVAAEDPRVGDLLPALFPDDGNGILVLCEDRLQHRLGDLSVDALLTQGA